MMARVFALAPLSFLEPKLELRDEDLDNKEFHLEEPWQHLHQPYEMIWEDDLNTNWIDDEKDR